jgi:hypothetical protein
VRFAIFGVLALLAAWPLLSTAPAMNDFRDAHVLSHYEAAAASAIRDFGQAPLWDRSYCGGMYLLGTPQARFVSPTFLLTLLFGEARGESLTAFAMLLVGLEGAFRYARSRGASSLGALLAAPVFALSGAFAVAPALGWINFYGFALVPWIALGARRALRGERVGVVIAAVATAICIGFGGTYATPLASLWCAFEVVERLVRDPKRGLVTLGRAAGVAIAVLGLSAVRLWPIFETLRDAPRVIGGNPGHAPGALAGMLLGAITRTSGDIPDEGTFFVGTLAIPAVALGVWHPRSRPLVVVGVIWLWLAAGYERRPSLFALLRTLPIYETLRYPERFLILFALALSALAAHGVTRAVVRLRAGRSFSPVYFSVAALALVAAVVPATLQHYAAAMHRELVAPPVAVDRPFHQARGTRWALGYYAPMQRGSLSCWDAYPVPQSPLLRGDRASEEWLEDGDAGAVKERASSPNRIELDVDLARPARLAVNQNWHAGWKADVGDVQREHGLLVVDLPAGRYPLTLRFLPRSAVGGALVSLASLVVLALFARLSTRAWRLAWLAPAVTLGAALAFVPEAKANAEPPESASGEPIVADALEQGTIRLGARLEGGVTLEAATLRESSLRAGETVVLELDWRRERAITPGLGVFVHVEPSAGDTIGGDHVLLSQTLLLDDAPPDKVLRDLLPITLPSDAAGKHWKIWVGLWGVRRDGKRMRVQDEGSAIVEGDAILAASFDVE